MSLRKKTAKSIVEGLGAIIVKGVLSLENFEIFKDSYKNSGLKLRDLYYALEEGDDYDARKAYRAVKYFIPCFDFKDPEEIKQRIESMKRVNVFSYAMQNYCGDNEFALWVVKGIGVDGFAYEVDNLHEMYY